MELAQVMVEAWQVQSLRVEASRLESQEGVAVQSKGSVL